METPNDPAPPEADVIQYAERLLSETREEIGRADQKAAILLSAVGVGAAVLVGLLIGHWSPTSIHAGVQWLWWVGAVALSLAVLFLGAAIMPRTAHAGDPSTVTYFGHVVQLTDRKLLVEHLRRAAAAPLDRCVDQLVMLSAIATRKYYLTQVAIWLVLGATLAMAASVLIGTVLT